MVKKYGIIKRMRLCSKSVKKYDIISVCVYVATWSGSLA